MKRSKHSGADHRLAHDRRVADRAEQDRLGGLPTHRGGETNEPTLAPAVRGDADGANQGPDAAEEGKNSTKKLLVEAELEKRMLQDFSERNF